jgi:hypothetical protein
LDADAARLESRQPIPLEQTLAALAQDQLKGLYLAVTDEQLEQHVVVGVDEHKRAV